MVTGEWFIILIGGFLMSEATIVGRQYSSQTKWLRGLFRRHGDEDVVNANEIMSHVLALGIIASVQIVRDRKDSLGGARCVAQVLDVNGSRFWTRTSPMEIPSSWSWFLPRIVAILLGWSWTCWPKKHGMAKVSLEYYSNHIFLNCFAWLFWTCVGQFLWMPLVKGLFKHRSMLFWPWLKMHWLLFLCTSHMFDKKRFLWKYGFPQFKWILLDYHIFFPIEMAITGDYDNPLGKNMTIQ
jgi:hypothetical protein